MKNTDIEEVCEAMESKDISYDVQCKNKNQHTQELSKIEYTEKNKLENMKERLLRQYWPHKVVRVFQLVIFAECFAIRSMVKQQVHDHIYGILISHRSIYFCWYKYANTNDVWVESRHYILYQWKNVLHRVLRISDAW